MAIKGPRKQTTGRQTTGKRAPTKHTDDAMPRQTGRKMKTRRTSAQLVQAVSTAMTRIAAGEFVEHVLQHLKLNKTTFYKTKKELATARELATGHRAEKITRPTVRVVTDAHIANDRKAASSAAQARRAAAFSKVKQVQSLVASGAMKPPAAIASVGWAQSKYYYWHSIMTKTATERAASGHPSALGHAANGQSSPATGRALVTTIDGRGRKLVDCRFIFDALQLLRKTIPQLEQLIGCETGTIQKYLTNGMCPNEFALAVNGLMAEATLTRNGTGGYVQKRNRKIVLVKIPDGHIVMLASMVEHLGGEVMHKEV